MEFNAQLLFFYLSLTVVGTLACFLPEGLFMMMGIMLVGSLAFVAKHIGIIEFLQVFVGCASFLAILWPVMRFCEKRAERNLEILKGLVQSRFPTASSKEIYYTARKLKRGHSLGDFIWDGNRVILVAGNNAKIVGGNGWIPLKAPKRPYLYAAQQQELAYRLAMMDVTLTPKVNHDLCALLFFNWKIESLAVDQHSNTMAAALRRRDDSRIEHFPLQPTRAIAAP
ncbi:hypothetical protein RBE51_20485 [Pseudomonas taiwanensis]|uniref:hypothetical protein n=1 Tax=Pseudomonas taiwanensis TaxID=470150 RepID=UPI0028DE8023|nr:hypothetical protein [Pseudomonas taiwanensis]MDT8925173.1 hypothetical protein [Pseudomonas taiwanensis]